MTFKLEDAEDDGHIKREVGQKLKSVLARESAELYEHFVNVCEEKGRDPSNVLGDYVIRCIENDDLAQAVARTEVDLSAVKQNDIREDDLELVMDMMERFDSEDDGGDDPIMDMINERIRAAGQGPLGGLYDQQDAESGGGGRRVKELERQIEELRKQNQALMQQVQQSSEDTQVEVKEQPDPEPEQTTETVVVQDDEDIDSLFDEGGENNEDNTTGDGQERAAGEGEGEEVEVQEEQVQSSGGEEEDDSSEGDEIEVKDFGSDDGEDDSEEAGGEEE